MSVTPSEAYLHHLANRTFLKPWTVPNAYRAPGKELSDLVVVFGNDVIVFSDKASAFRDTPDQRQRWRRDAIEGSVRQLGGAMRELSRETPRIFEDSKAKERPELVDVLPQAENRRIHLVGVARPNQDPKVTPAGWAGLRTVKQLTGAQLEVGPLSIGGRPVHLFDGTTIDLLLETLDTAPDFISYLIGRERAMNEASQYAFSEADLLAASIFDWAAGDGLAPHVPNLSQVRPGLWKEYIASGRAERSRAANESSRVIDELVKHFDQSFSEGAFLNVKPTFASHEFAMRLLAGESRFARRMIASALDEIRAEENQRTFWSATVPSPTHSGLRYLWFTYPQPPDSYQADVIEKDLQEQLRRQMYVTAGQFGARTLIGIALPNRGCTDDIVAMEVLDASNWTDEDRQRATQVDAGFGPASRTDYYHLP